MSNYIRAVRSPKKKLTVANFLRGMDAGHDESVLPPSVAKGIYNLDFSTGALREGYGLTAYPDILRPVASVWTFVKHDFETETDRLFLMYADLDGQVYYRMNGVEYVLDGVVFSSPPVGTTYRLYGEDVVLMTGADDPMWVWDGATAAYSVPNSPRITHMTMHFERMFCTVAGEKNAVWFSDDLDPTNWDTEIDKGGFIQILDERGKLNRVLSYLNYVYILRDHGISRLTAYADQNDFSVVNLFVSSGKIYAGSAALCGDSVFFLADDGLYRFDGLSTRKVLETVAPLVRKSPDAAGAYFDGKYYLAFNAGYSDTDNGQNNAVLVYDPDNGAYSVLTDVCVKRFAVLDEGLLAVLGDGRKGLVARTGSVFGIATRKSWTGGFSDLGTEKRKTVREVYVESDGPFTLTVESERVKKVFACEPVPGITKIRVNVAGRKIAISLAADTEKVRISKPTVIFSES
jgi:hypothetical protein